MNGILSVLLPRWEGLGEGENRKGFSPPPLSSPIKGEEIVFNEIRKPRPVGGVIHSEVFGQALYSLSTKARQLKPQYRFIQHWDQIFFFCYPSPVLKVFTGAYFAEFKSHRTLFGLPLVQYARLGKLQWDLSLVLGSWRQVLSPLGNSASANMS